MRGVRINRRGNDVRQRRGATRRWARSPGQVARMRRGPRPIVVLDWSDMKALTEAGALVTILERKIRGIEEQSGLRSRRLGDKGRRRHPVPCGPLTRSGPSRLAVRYLGAVGRSERPRRDWWLLGMDCG